MLDHLHSTTATSQFFVFRLTFCLVWQSALACRSPRSVLLLSLYAVLEVVCLHFIFIPQKYQNISLFPVVMRMHFLNKLPDYVLAIQPVQNRRFQKVAFVLVAVCVQRR